MGLVSELRPTAGCVLMDLASLAVSRTSVYASGLTQLPVHHPVIIQVASVNWAILQHWGGCRYRHFAANFKAF